MSNPAKEMIIKRLKDAREYLGISQEEAAKALKISRSAISLIETGDRKIDSLELMGLSKLYQRPIAYFTEDDYSVDLDPEAAVFARKLSAMSDKDKKEIMRFAEFLESKGEE